MPSNNNNSNSGSNSNNNANNNSNTNNRNNNSSGNSNAPNTTTEDPNEGINKEACAKYGITIQEIPLEPVEPYSRYKSDDTVYGFITEVTHDQKGTEIEIKDWGYCLEQNDIELGFENMPRSQIMEEVIKTYGLVPIVDLSGLRDDTISWDNSTSKSSASGGGAGGDSTGSASIDEAVDNAIKGKSNPLDKAKAVDKAFKSHVIYSYYYDVHHPDLDEAWSNAHLNCADGANVMSAMFSRAGIKVVIVHVPSHYIVKLSIGGKTYYTDNAAADGQHTTRAFGQVWNGNTSGSEVGTKIPG